MLKPFRIRNLYFHSSDFVDCSGVVQLSPQQYDQEIQVTPDALLAYLDEDDGETVTVGSSFELEQRLLEPPGRFSSWQGHLASENPPPLHVFDIQRSARAAEAWRNYAIPAEAWSKYARHYCQPSAPVPAQEPGPRLEKGSHNDYQSLLAKFQVLELEVKLLNEAFRMHAIATPVPPQQAQRPVRADGWKNLDLFTHLPPQQAQRSVFANACKNSDLFNHGPNINPHLASTTHKPSSLIAHERPFPENFGSNLWHQPQLHVPKPDKLEDAATTNDGPSDSSNSRSRARDRAEFLDPFRLQNARLLEQGPARRELDTFDPVALGILSRPQHLAQHDSIPEISKLGTSSTESSSREASHSDNPVTPGKEMLGEDTSVRPHVNRLSSGPSLPHAMVDIETAATTSPAVPFQQPALKSLLDLEPEAEIARFPTIFQLEKEGLRTVKSKSTTAQDSDSSPPSLTRANTVTSSNPAARLLKPFDPAAEGLGVSSNHSPVPRRSGTERYRRRPYAEQFSGTGRTLWEEFERSGPQAQSTAPRLFSRPEPRPLDTAPQHPTPSVIRSQSLNHHRHSNHPHLHRLAPMRSALDLSGTQPGRDILPTLNELRHPPAAASSTPNLPRRSATVPNNKRSNHIQSCIRTLQDMGFKPHSRLPVYAEACNGNVSKAMTMAEEDEKATLETRKITEMTEKVLNCVQQLKEMGYGVERHDEELKEFARKAGGDVGLAVEGIEGPNGSEMEDWRERRRIGTQEQAGMPGSFP